MSGGLQEFAETGRDIGIMSDIGTSGVDADKSRDFGFTAWFAVGDPEFQDIADALQTADVAIIGDVASPDTRLVADGLGFAMETDGVAGTGVLPSMRFDAPDDLFSGAASVRIVSSVATEDDVSPIAIVRAACRVALALAGMEGCLAVGWMAADSAMGSGYFRRTVGHWLAGGPFPALGLTSMALDDEGAMVSRGLHSILGQELRVLATPEHAAADQARIAIRVIDHLVEHGPAREADVVEVDGYGRFELEPAGEFVNLRHIPFA